MGQTLLMEARGTRARREASGELASPFHAPDRVARRRRRYLEMRGHRTAGGRRGPR